MLSTVFVLEAERIGEASIKHSSLFSPASRRNGNSDGANRDLSAEPLSWTGLSVGVWDASRLVFPNRARLGRCRRSGRE